MKNWFETCLLTRPSIRRRIWAAALVVCIMVTMMPMQTYAVKTVQTVETMETAGLCEHHTEHTLECGYTEAIEGSPCMHLADGKEHTEDCYKMTEVCVHEHTEDCYDTGADLASDSDAEEPVNCEHLCGEDSGCITQELKCLHQRGEHDDTCGYIKETEGMPCAYVCEICYSAEMQPMEANALKAMVSDKGWVLNGGELTISSDAGMADWVTTEKETNGDKITTVTIDEEVTEIPKEAFATCENLTSVTANGATSIGNYAFSYCFKLATAEFPATKTINNNAFMNCKKLTSVTIPTSVTYIGVSAFNGCESLASVTFEGITPPATIGTFAFANNSSDLVIYVPQDNVDAYKNASGLSDVKDKIRAVLLPLAPTPTVTFSATGSDTGILGNVGTGMKYSTDGTTWTEISSSDNISLTGLNVCTISVVKQGNGTTTSDSETQTISVTRADPPTGVGKTDETVAENGGTITGVTATMEYKLSTNSTYTNISGTTVTGLAPGTYHVRTKATGTVLASEDTSVTITVKDKVNAVAPTISTDLSETEVTYTKDAAATALSISATVTDSGTLSYEWYSNTTKSTTGGSKLTGTAASYTPSTADVGTTYYYCIVTNTITDNGDGGTKTATATSAVANIKVEATSADKGWEINEDGNLTISTPEGMTDWATKVNANKDKVKTVTIAEAVTGIPNNAFKECTNLEKVTADGAITIGDSAFHGCSKLSGASFPAATRIGFSAFWSCTELASTNFPVVKTIGTFAFSACTKLDTLKLPAAPPTANTTAFKNCPINRTLNLVDANSAPLTDAALATAQAAYKAVNDSSMTGEAANNGTWYGWTIGEPAADEGWTIDASGNLTISTTAGMDDWKTTGLSANKDSVTTVTIAEGIAKINRSAFENCTNLTSVSIPDSVTNIELNAFGNCTNLTSVSIPDSVTTIGSSAFRKTGLVSVTFKGTNPPSFEGSTVFFDTPDALVIYVPQGSVDAYKGVSNLSGVIDKIQVALLPRESTPAATFSATGSDTGILGNVGTGMKYSTDGTTWTEISSSDNISLTGLNVCTISVVKKGDGTTTSDSEAQTISVTRAATPTGVGKTDETMAENDGTITGVTTMMEYKLSTSSNYTDGSGTTVTGLAPGTYQVRTKATGTVLASEDISVIITAKDKVNAVAPTISTDLSETEVTYTKDAAATALSISATVTDGGTLSYEWYSNTTNSITGGTKLTGTAASYTPSTVDEGTTYYYCIVTNTIADNGDGGTKTATATSAVANIKVEATSADKGWAIDESGNLTISTDDGMTDWVTSGLNANKTNVKKVTIDEAVAVIADKAFLGCTNLESVTADGAITIGKGAFYECTKLSSAYFPAATTINGQAFYHCTALATLSLPAAPPSVTDADVFLECPPVRALRFVNPDGSILTGNALATAQANYKQDAGDGNATDTLWYGWKTDVVPTVDKSALITAIANAKSIMANTVISVQGGADVSTSTYWVLPDIMSAAKSALSEAEAIVAKADVTQEEVDNAVVKLNAKVNIDFKNAKKAGRKSSGGSGNGGGSSSGDSGGSSSSTTPAPSQPVVKIPGTGQATIPTTVDQNGNANVSVTDKNITDAIADAKRDAVQGQPITVEIKVNTDKDASQLITTLPQSVLDTLINNQVGSLTIGNKDVSMTFSQAAISQMNAQAQGNLIITAMKADTAKLIGNAQTLIGNRPTYDFKAICDGKSITDLGANAVTITIPYILKEGETAANMQAIRVDANGVATVVPGSVYDVTKQAVVFATGNVTATYGISYSQVAVPATSSEVIHTVQKGEILAEIAKRYRTTIQDIANLNNIQNPDQLEIGQTIRIPQ